ncbi:SKI family transcriptional corepressor 2 isoform X3 [Daktulosphaira vitifoliae]|uniref:SKI family transcriptional corepressor 2 isoform X3 n=1 Tax=Daktulosphaira vitifoliae TaxID=58002 RepID=UPI0021AA9D51|nr:SKI family transcriptional corepressor 2 isoform X3 [Daktulosphaira vitifoliae]
MKMTLVKMDQRFQMIGHHRDDKPTEPSRALIPVTNNSKPNKVGTVILYGVPIVSLQMDNQERLCLAQISNTLLHRFSYNEIHNRRVALGITCVQCTPVQLEMLRRAGAMPVSSRRCGMITRREAERLCNSFLGDNTPPRLPDDFAFAVHHECAWGCRGSFLPSRYNSSRAKCIRCSVCGLFFSPNKFIFHSHRTGASARYVQPDAANFNSWRRHMKLSDDPPDHVVHAWEDVKAMFNGGTRKRAVSRHSPQPAGLSQPTRPSSPPPVQPVTTVTSPAHQRERDVKKQPIPVSLQPPVPVPSMPLHQAMVDYVWQQRANPFAVAAAAAAAYSAGGGLPCWLPKLDLDAHSALIGRSSAVDYSSAFRPVRSVTMADDDEGGRGVDDEDDDEIDIETCPEEQNS